MKPKSEIKQDKETQEPLEEKKYFTGIGSLPWHEKILYHFIKFLGLLGKELKYFGKLALYQLLGRNRTN